MTQPLSHPGNPPAPEPFYREHGYHIEPDVFSPAFCDALVEAAQGFPNAQSGVFKPEMMPHRKHPLFLEALKNPRLKEIVAALVGGPPVGLQTEFFYCRPGTRGFSLHQDNFYVEAPEGAFASAWIALTDTYKEKGGLIVYPGTHKEGQLPVRKLNLVQDAGQDPNANNEEAVVPPHYAPLYPAVPKGAALFLHGHLVHASCPNATDQFRYVLLCTYARGGVPFRPGKYAQREAVPL